MLPRIYGIDIESSTDPLTEEELMQGWVQGSRGINPLIGRVVNIGVSIGESVEVIRGREVSILRELDCLLRELPPGMIVTWNGSGYDLPFLHTRARLLGVEMGLKVWEDSSRVPKYEALPGWFYGVEGSWSTKTGVDHSHFDVAYALEDYLTARGIKWSLKPAARSLGIEMVEVERDKIHLLSPKEQDEYVASDARGTSILAGMLLSGALAG